MRKVYATVLDRAPIDRLPGKYITTTIFSDGVAEMVISRPPVNALGGEVFDEIGAHALLLKNNPNVKVVTFTAVSQRGTFIGGADVDMFFTFTKPEDGQEVSARYQEVLRKAFREMGKPVIVGVNGVALGGGFELALFGHEIIAAESARFGQPELGLNLIPGAGGTQNLTRRAGAKVAMTAIIESAWKGPNFYAPATLAKKLNLVDEVVSDAQLSDRLRARALELAAMPDTDRVGWVRRRQEILEDRPVDANKDGGGLAYLDTVDVTKLVPPALVKAAQNALEAIRAAYTQDLTAGLVTEARLFGELAHTQTTKDAVYGLRGLPKPPRVVLPDKLRFTGEVAAPSRIVVVGAGGNMGSGIAHNANFRGDFDVLGIEDQPDLAARARERIGGIYQTFYVGKGKMSAADADTRMARVATTHDYTQIAAGDFVIEAAFEDLAVKREIARRVHAQGAFLISNTSGLDPDAFEADLVLHYFNPPGGMKIVEVVPTQRTTPEILAKALAFLKRIGKTPIFLQRPVHGFLVNRMFAHICNEALWALLEGNKLEDVDGAMFLFGFPEGAIAGMERFGFDIGGHTARNMDDAYAHMAHAPLWDALMSSGRLGIKAGKGVYAGYTSRGVDLKSGLAPEVQAIIDEMALKLAGPHFDANRVLYAMINEAAHIIGDGVLGEDRSAAAHTIDHALTFAVAFPGYTGGLLRLADRIGIQEIVQELEQLRDERGERLAGSRFEPAPLLRELAQSGRGFHTPA